MKLQDDEFCPHMTLNIHAMKFLISSWQDILLFINRPSNIDDVTTQDSMYTLQSPLSIILDYLRLCNSCTLSLTSFFEIFNFAFNTYFRPSFLKSSCSIYDSIKLQTTLILRVLLLALPGSALKKNMLNIHYCSKDLCSVPGQEDPRGGANSSVPLPEKLHDISKSPVYYSSKWSQVVDENLMIASFRYDIIPVIQAEINQSLWPSFFLLNQRLNHVILLYTYVSPIHPLALSSFLYYSE